MTSNQTYATYEVGSTITLRLPTIDQRYLMNHHEEPFIHYPGEVVREYTDGKGNRYCISNYCRVYSYKKKNMVKSVPSLYLPSWIKQNFTAEELDNEYTRFNMDAISPTNYYKTHREERLAYQKKYRDDNIEKVRANEKKYREANHDKLLEMAKARRDAKKAAMTEEEHERVKAKAREYYRRRKERLAQQGIEAPSVEEVFNRSSESGSDDDVLREE